MQNMLEKLSNLKEDLQAPKGTSPVLRLVGQVPPQCVHPSQLVFACGTHVHWCTPLFITRLRQFASTFTFSLPSQ